LARRERRRHQRRRVRFSCQLSHDGQTVAGVVRDLSNGGLSIETPVELDQGEGVRVRLEPPGRAPLTIDAFVWNVRSGRQRSTGTTFHRLGLVLSEAPVEFEALLGRPRQTPRPGRVEDPPARPATELPKAAAATEPPPPRSESEQKALPAARRYRARVARNGTSRTRSILVFADTPEEADARVRLEIGEDWRILELASA